MNILDRIRLAPKKLAATSRLWRGEDLSVFQWATEGIIARNWGDKLNPYLAEHITGRKVIYRADVYQLPPRPVHYWIGSHLETACNDPNAVVWGAGFISSDVVINGYPKAIHSVRGWLSNEKLKQAGLEAPSVVGDAALLLPRFYQPKHHLERHTLGVIPHCFEWNEPFFNAAKQWEDTRVIDICGEIEHVVEQIVSCDRIISSSLHGIICADAYGIPAIWLKASEKPKGDGFKFLDYFSSVGRLDDAPIAVCGETSRSEVESQFRQYKIDIDLDALWRACPLRRANR